MKSLHSFLSRFFRMRIAVESTRKFLAASLRVLPHTLRGRVSGRWIKSRCCEGCGVCQRNGPFVARERGAAPTAFCFSVFIKSELSVGKLCARRPLRVFLPSRLQFTTEPYPCKGATGYNRGSMTNCTRTSVSLRAP